MIVIVKKWSGQPVNYRLYPDVPQLPDVPFEGQVSRAVEQRNELLLRDICEQLRARRPANAWAKMGEPVAHVEMQTFGRRDFG